MLVYPLLSLETSCCLQVYSLLELLRMQAGAAGLRGGIIHHPNSTETGNNSGCAYLCMTLYCILYKRSGQTATHSSKVAKGTGSGRVFIGRNLTLRVSRKVENRVL